MTLITILLSAAVTLFLAHCIPVAWRLFVTKEPALAHQLQTLKLEAEKEVSTMTEDMKQKLAAVGARIVALSEGKSAAEQALAAKSAELDSVSAHVADLTAQVAQLQGDASDTSTAIDALVSG